MSGGCTRKRSSISLALRRSSRLLLLQILKAQQQHPQWPPLFLILLEVRALQPAGVRSVVHPDRHGFRLGLEDDPFPLLGCLVDVAVGTLQQTLCGFRVFRDEIQGYNGCQG